MSSIKKNKKEKGLDKLPFAKSRKTCKISDK